jgi:prefoldin subunit 5
MEAHSTEVEHLRSSLKYTREGVERLNKQIDQLRLSERDLRIEIGTLLQIVKHTPEADEAWKNEYFES